MVFYFLSISLLWRNLNHVLFSDTADVWWFTWSESKGSAEAASDFPSHSLPLATKRSHTSNTAAALSGGRSGGWRTSGMNGVRLYSSCRLAAPALERMRHVRVWLRLWGLFDRRDTTHAWCWCDDDDDDGSSPTKDDAFWKGIKSLLLMLWHH